MKKNILYSAIATWMTIPLWLLLISIWALSQAREINSKSVVPFIGLLLTLGFPFALYVSFILAPSLDQLKVKSRFQTILITIVSHAIALITIYPLYRIINTETFEWSNLLIFPFYLLLFFTPPSCVGCMVYFLFSEKDSSQS